MTARLHDLDALAADVRRPAYDRAQLRPGIVHLGLGAFHRAHQAPATDDALEAEFGPWGIEGVSLRSADVAERLNPQDGLYGLLIRGPEGVSARVIGAVQRVHVLPQDPEAVLRRLANPATRIVSLTVTEKAYGLDPSTGGLDRDHPAVRADLARDGPPTGVVGLLVEGLRRRHAEGLGPFTALSCDNLPDNGGVLRRLVLDFAEAVAPDLARWIEAEGAFPATMVDRITPASTDATYADAAQLLGFEDRAAVETEPFSQWVIEDRFVQGRPRWEAGGALFVERVAAYEKMKLRLLNGAHSLLAYVGLLAGKTYVRDVMAEPILARMVANHMAAAARTLDPVPGIDLDDYARALRQRFANPAIAHRLAQIAEDGSAKLPQRLLLPAQESLEAGRPVATFALGVAAWAEHLSTEIGAGRGDRVRDPRAADLSRALGKAPLPPSATVAALADVPGLWPAPLASRPDWHHAVATWIEALRTRGPLRALEPASS